MYRFIEKIRKEPIEVRQQIVFLITIVFVMGITVLWFLGSLVKFSSMSTDQSEASQNAAVGTLQEPYAQSE